MKQLAKEKLLAVANMTAKEAGKLTKKSSELETVAVNSKTKKPGKREAIIAAATDLFTNEGYETTTIAEVAKKAGVAVGTVYLYFKNKQEMLYAVKEQWEGEFVQYMVQADLNKIPHQYRTRPLVEACFRACADQSEKVQLMRLPPQIMGEIYATKGLGKSTPTMQQAIKRWFDEAIKDGVFQPVDTEAAAVIAFSMVSASLEQCFQVENTGNQEVYINVLVEAFERWMLRPEFWQA